SLLGAWICYRWALDLYGTASAFTACALWCFCPTILGNAPLVMPDVPAAALSAASCYTFWRWLKAPSWVKTATAGVVLGLAELTKTTLVIFYPLWPLIWFAYRMQQRQKMRLHDWLREAAMMAI